MVFLGSLRIGPKCGAITAQYEHRYWNRMMDRNTGPSSADGLVPGRGYLARWPTHLSVVTLESRDVRNHAA